MSDHETQLQFNLNNSSEHPQWWCAKTAPIKAQLWNDTRRGDTGGISYSISLSDHETQLQFNLNNSSEHPQWWCAKTAPIKAQL
ncbi:unnamed protein product [Pieris macdunnoughi]|uniref:Uncharacterized protein n=1 Tax=Pieris macdunnoughi TaxID=345717 RepID=A0A821WA99_9NEOP|nr:unnamed protein product [Pieris macdunnoughi]